MGLDIHVSLLWGYKLGVDGLIDPGIFGTDDYQMTLESEYRNPIISKWVIDPKLKEFLQTHPTWNFYILTTSQGKSDPTKSSVFLFDKKQELYSGRVCDYETGEVDIDPSDTAPIQWHSGVDYRLHWIVESDW